jgi:DNA polymerase IV
MEMTLTPNPSPARRERGAEGGVRDRHPTVGFVALDHLAVQIARRQSAILRPKAETPGVGEGLAPSPACPRELDKPLRYAGSGLLDPSRPAGAQDDSLGNDSLADRPIVVGGLRHERGQVVDLSVEAQRAGVRRGMTLRQAQQICSTAVFLPLDREALDRERERALEVLERFSPAVEPRGLEGAYLDLGGLTLLYGEPPVLAAKIVRALADELGLTARIGIGPGRFVAWLAARNAASAPRIIQPDQAREWVARQSAHLLPLTEEGREHLRRLGVNTIGHFAKLPAPDIALHFGPEGKTAHRLARGQDPATVTARTRPETVEASMELESVRLDSRQVVDAARWLAARVIERLRGAHRSARALTVRVELDSGEAIRRDRRLPAPCDTAADAARFVEAMVGDLTPCPPSPKGKGERTPPAEPVLHHSSGLAAVPSLHYVERGSGGEGEMAVPAVGQAPVAWPRDGQDTGPCPTTRPPAVRSYVSVPPSPPDPPHPLACAPSPSPLCGEGDRGGEGEAALPGAGRTHAMPPTDTAQPVALGRGDPTGRPYPAAGEGSMPTILPFVPPSRRGKGDRGLGEAVTTSPSPSAPPLHYVERGQVGEVEPDASPRVVLLTVTARDLGPEVARQQEMFAGSRQRRPALEWAVEQIGKRYGNHVKRIVITDEHAVLPTNQFRLEDYV